jgi:hypothetical protein
MEDLTLDFCFTSGRTDGQGKILAKSVNACSITDNASTATLRQECEQTTSQPEMAGTWLWHQ